MRKEYTATVYIIHENKTLMVFHRKFQKWTPPGGHVEPNESPVEAARREVLEETGLTIEFIKQENIWLDYPNAASVERPYLCLVEQIEAYKEMPPHQHIDFVYVARPLSQVQEAEEDPCRWFSLEELQALKPGEDIFKDTLDVALHLLSSPLAVMPQQAR